MQSSLGETRAWSGTTEKHTESFQRSRQSEDQELREQAARLYATLEQIREENRVLNGRIEEIHHTLQPGSQAAGQTTQEGVVDRLGVLETDIRRNSERIERMEQYLNLKVPEEAAPPTPTAGAPPAPEPEKPSEEDLYNAAKEAFSQADYEGARRGFQLFIDTYPTSKNADNAQFWIGETYYKEKWYEKAILEYQKVIENYPKGNKVRASLLKQGFSFYNIGDKANARLIFKELIGRYPKSNEAALAEKKLKGF